MEEKEEGQQQDLVLKPSSLTKISSSESSSMLSATLGRVMHTLLNARPKKLQDTISRLQSPPKMSPLSVSLEQSLWFLHKYVGEAAEKGETLDEVLVPMLEHSLKSREFKHNSQALILVNWLFQDEVLFLALTDNLVNIISRKDDRYIVLGWCTLARNLVEYETSMIKLPTNGIMERYTALLKALSSCITPLVALLCSGSTLQGGFELPTRLAVGAADFILSHTVALTRKDLGSGLSAKKAKLFNSNIENQPISMFTAGSKETLKTASKSSELSGNLEMKQLLWDHIDDLIVLVDRLRAWSRKSRLLHSRGLENVLNWLQETKKRYFQFQDEADMQILKTGILLLSSCWKHYGMLAHLVDCNFSLQYKELLEQYLSGIQFYADNRTEESSMDKSGGLETIKFFLNCVSLLLGRLDSKQFDTALADYGPQLLKVLISQLRCVDEEVIDDTVSIFRAAVFRSNQSSSEDYPANTREMKAVMPLLLHLLDERDGAAKAVVKLVAEYCSLSLDNDCVKEVLQRLISGSVSRKMNAIDVVSDIIDISSESARSLPPHMWQDIADNLLECLADQKSVIQIHASRLIPFIEPSLILPTLVHHVYSLHEKVQHLASDTLLAVLKIHKDEAKVLCMLLDCLSNLSHRLGPSIAAADGKDQKVDADRVLKLLPEFSKIVEDWNSMISVLLDKLFAEPSNAVIVKSLSYMGEHLADSVDLVFHRLLLYAAGQNDTNENAPKWDHVSSQNVDTSDFQHYLFRRLCPLLVIKLLPLRVFDNLDSSLLYGHQSEHGVWDSGPLAVDDAECISSLLINRALDKFETEDIRKLAAELCGRIHPHVLIPIISSQLESAAKAGDTMKIKACLFSVCTSLMIRGKDSYNHPGMGSIRLTIETILCWPSANADDVLKAQHGCIDCLAWMMCTELDGSKTMKSTTLDGANSEASVCTYVIHLLTHKEHSFMPSALGRWSRLSEATVHLPFRLCMANVLISACQKISNSGKEPLAKIILPPVIRSARVIEEPDIRAACNQVLFTAVYYLKSVVLPFSSDFLKVALQSLRDGSEKERITGAKLLVSLVASEEEVLQTISSRLLEARALLQSISSSDPSEEVRQMCRKLLLCLMSS